MVWGSGKVVSFDQKIRYYSIYTFMVSSNIKHNHNNNWPSRAMTISFPVSAHSFTNAGSSLNWGGEGEEGGQVIGRQGERIMWENTDFKNLL